jgi:hypothetical protein
LESCELISGNALETLRAGVDISLKELVAFAMSLYGGKTCQGALPNSPEGIEKLAGQLAGAMKRLGLPRIVIAFEDDPSRSLLFADAMPVASALRPFGAGFVRASRLRIASRKPMARMGGMLGAWTFADFARAGKGASEPLKDWRP